MTHFLSCAFIDGLLSRNTAKQRCELRTRVIAGGVHRLRVRAVLVNPLTILSAEAGDFEANLCIDLLVRMLDNQNLN